MKSVTQWGICNHAVGSRAPDLHPPDGKLFTEDEKRELIDFLAENPLAGAEIPGTGGVRKVRFAASGRGKRGGARIIYYYLDDTMPLYALQAYAKNDQGDMTPDEKRAVSALAAALKATRKEKR
ncbi:type II toxin-antitoxin system RelE/ParE family toxin [Sedimentimonas flavescens]|uniref:type II toxin-antitoxin system RelE/ParE family toxin n=1 Tax=Sedimentimonas flavescens TaxID=2851012 RepID=UPI0021A724D6|nr:type II toxin-antitoxin system RelE/ParE family toxin [Sedimentimonas flavescens]MCT2541256.1 type II toxin-antitoxin system RelE/ParE family toxin [Sedimentimonas flavescens]